MRWPVFILTLFLGLSLMAQGRNEELLRFAVDQVNDGQFTVAEQALSKLLSDEPAHVDAIFLRAYCRYKLDRDNAAMADLDRLVKMDEAYVNAYLIRARLHRRKGNYWASLSDYNRARRLDPYQTFFTITRGFLSETK